MFFSILLHKFYWEVDDKLDSGWGYIIPKRGDIEELADGTIHISARCFEEENFDYRHYIFILLHELFHIIFQHSLRQGGRDSKIWNIACDHVINSQIKKLFSEKDVFPPGKLGYEGIAYFPNEIKNPSATSEEVYEYLIQDKYRFSLESVTHGDGVTTYTIKDNKTGQTFTTTEPNTKNEDFDNFCRQAGEVYRQMKERGSIPGNFSEVFDKFFNSELPWDETLRDAIKKSVTPAPNNRGWKTINKRFMAHGYTLPGVMNDYEDNVDIGVISIDTSGSISSEELQEFANILLESLRKFRKMIMITHDHIVHQVEEFHYYDELKLQEYISKIGFKGRGGTSHGDVFNKIKEIEDRENDGISIYISLTDGYSDIEEQWKTTNNSWFSRVPSVFVITKRGKIPTICKEDKNPKAIKINK